MAASHSFDVNTLLALKSLKFKALTDGYGYCQHFNTDMVLVPQLTSKPVDLGFGLHTFCVHVNHLKPKAIYNLIRIIKENYKKFVDFQEVVNEPVIDYLQHKLLRRITEFSLRGIRAVRR
ncbi:MAG: hypothetical protein H3C43_06370 [Leptonema sp. (in: Bacteria)]|nr:hypothetical protein [Leptonema sp. (in: bacteria)]